MQTPDRAPSMPSWMCADCGYPLAARMTDLARAEHEAYHLRASHRRRTAMGEIPITAADWRKYAIALEKLDRARVDERRTAVDPLNRRIVDLELSVASYEWDLKVLNELVDDLKADLRAVTEGENG